MVTQQEFPHLERKTLSSQTFPYSQVFQNIDSEGPFEYKIQVFKQQLRKEYQERIPLFSLGNKVSLGGLALLLDNTLNRKRIQDFSKAEKLKDINHIL